MVLYGSGMSDGNTHNNYNVPVVVVGGRDSALKATATSVPEGHSPGEPVAGLIERFGVNMDKFGDSARPRSIC